LIAGATAQIWRFVPGSAIWRSVPYFGSCVHPAATNVARTAAIAVQMLRIVFIPTSV
jgi:hypothetical protein